LLDGFFYANKNAYRPSHDSETEKANMKRDFLRKKVDWRLL
jgi:hypothetical protein